MKHRFSVLRVASHAHTSTTYEAIKFLMNYAQQICVRYALFCATEACA